MSLPWPKGVILFTQAAGNRQIDLTVLFQDRQCPILLLMCLPSALHSVNSNYMRFDFGPVHSCTTEAGVICDVSRTHVIWVAN